MNAPAGLPAASVVLISSVHWHFTWQRHHEISRGLAARGHRVVFVEPLPKRWPRLGEASRVWGRLTGRRRLAGNCSQEEVAGVRVVSPRLLPDVGAPARCLNRRLATRFGRRLAASLPPPRMVLNYLPLSAAVALQRAIDPAVKVYDCVWDWPRDPFSGPGTIREDELLADVDMVFADAPFLEERMRAAHARVVRVPAAVDYDRFEPARRQGRRGDEPLCAYFGAVGANVDLDLLRRIGRAFPLRIVGPVDTELGELGERAEVIGAVDRDRLPELLADADVLVLPYARGGHNRGIQPAKTFECLATGKPTVAIGLPSLDEFGDLFVRCETPDEFLEAIPIAARQDGAWRERRLAAARENTWEIRLDTIAAALAAELARQGLAP